MIHILAKDTSDPVMYAVAREKETMFDAFVNKELAEGSYHIYLPFPMLMSILLRNARFVAR